MGTAMKKTAGLLALLGLLFLAETFLRGYYLRLVILFGVTSIVALGVTVINGYTNILSLGFGGPMMVAGDASVLLTLSPAYKGAVLHLPLWLEQARVSFPVAMICGGILAMFASVILLLSAFRLRGHSFVLASMGVTIVTGNLAENLGSLTHGDMGLRSIPAFTNIWWTYGLLVAVIYCIRRFMESKYGRALAVISRDRELAGVMGIDIARYKVLSFAIGGFITGIGAVLWVHLVLTMNPKAFGLEYVFQIVAMLAIGGTGTISGALVGAGILTFGAELLAPVQEGFMILGVRIPPAFGLVNVLMAVLLVLVMIYKPRGIMNGREIWEIAGSGRKKRRISKVPESEKRTF
jgi:branched-chain amino acid transport system permease protein